MPQATVHLLRHGEVHNPDGVLYGRLPEFHLSELGREMARMLAEHFARRAAQGAKIVHLAASPLTRAQETAQPDRRGPQPRDPHRRPDHRGRKLLRGPPGHQGRAPQAQALAARCATRSGPPGASPTRSRPPASWPPSRTPALRAIELRRRRRRGHPGQPPAAHLGHPAQRRGQAAVARPAEARMHPDLPHVPGVRRRRHPPARRVQRACRRPSSRCLQHPGSLSMTGHNPHLTLPPQRPRRRRRCPGRAHAGPVRLRPGGRPGQAGQGRRQQELRRRRRLGDRVRRRGPQGRRRHQGHAVRRHRRDARGLPGQGHRAELLVRRLRALPGGSALAGSPAPGVQEPGRAVLRREPPRREGHRRSLRQDLQPHLPELRRQGRRRAAGRVRACAARGRPHHAGAGQAGPGGLPRAGRNPEGHPQALIAAAVAE